MEQLRDLQAQLEKTTTALKEAVEKSEAGDSSSAAVQPPQKAEAGPKMKGLGTNRGIETMFRSAYRVQMELTALADNKANMMISINAIIISIIIAAVAPKLDTNPWLLIPTTVFLLGTLASVTYAVLAARPRLHSEPITLADLKHSEGNILYFGIFANMQEDEFYEGMVDLMQDRNVLYETMIRNIYGLGSVLNQKFALLQSAYTVFMVALALGVFSFIGVFAWIMGAFP
jgi:hypothetical protein